MCWLTAPRANGAQEASIPEIQGAGHTSPFAGQTLTTRGVVTAITGGGFYLQATEGDGNPATSDAIFVARQLPAGTQPGVLVVVEGVVREDRRRFGAPPSELTVTQIKDAVVRLDGQGTLPAPVVIGSAGQRPPTEIIDDDGMTVFDPDTDGLDFWESLEGMRALVEDALVVGPTNRFRETWTVADGGRKATGINADGGITIAPGDFNPERIQIQTFRDLVGNAANARRHDVGDRIPQVVGVIDYAFGNFELVATEIADPQPANRVERSTSLAAGPEHLLIASYNVENLDPQVEAAERVGGTGDIDDDVGDGRFQRIARHIVARLLKPDIVAVQEIQDNDGAEMTDVVAADQTLSVLIDAIEQEGGPRYSFIDRPPADDAEGGQPGGNIRVGFLFNPQRVQVNEAQIVRIGGPAFSGSRRPLAVPFRFNGRQVLIVNVHLTSKGGSDPLFGSVQPPANGGEPQRVRQAAAIRSFLRQLPADPDRRLVVVGDHNAFQFEPPLLVLTEGGEPQLVNLTNRLPLSERRSYVFEGNAQALDHLSVDPVSAGVADYEVLHLNSGTADPASDHDPLIVRIHLPPL